jgi:hypothetical protein
MGVNVDRAILVVVDQFDALTWHGVFSDMELEKYWIPDQLRDDEGERSTALMLCAFVR